MGSGTGLVEAGTRNESGDCVEQRGSRIQLPRGEEACVVTENAGLQQSQERNG